MNNIKKLMIELETLSNKYDYKTFEVALILFLRSDVNILDSISSATIKRMLEKIDEYDSIMCDLLKDDIDELLEGE